MATSVLTMTEGLHVLKSDEESDDDVDYYSSDFDSADSVEEDAFDPGDDVVLDQTDKDASHSCPVPGPSTTLTQSPTSPCRPSPPASTPQPPIPNSPASSLPAQSPRKRAAAVSPEKTPSKRPAVVPQDLDPWHGIDEEDELPQTLPFRPQRTPGVQLDRQKDYSPLELFMLFFSEDVVNVLCQNTNKNAERRLLKGQWKPLDTETMMKYLSIVIYLGLVKPSAMRDLWRKDRLHSHPFPSSVMAGYRFELIGVFLHMSDPAADLVNDQLRGQPGYDPLFRLKPLQDQILLACKAYYHPYQNITIDERMAASKARHGMKQYMKAKPIKWGFKLFALADSKTGYTFNFNVYQGKALTPSGNGLSYDAAVNLIHVPFLGKGYNLYVDNFYTSRALFLHLHQIRYGACGTMRENVLGFLKNRVNALPKTAERGEMRWLREGPLLYVKWKDTKEVTMCSSLHKAYGGDTAQRRIKNHDGSWSVRDVPIPQPVKEYNKYMGGVDLSDALIKYFTVSHKTMRWYKKLFLHFVDIAVVNSFILHKELAMERQRTPLTQKGFREALCLELADFRGVTAESEKAAETPQPQEAAAEDRPKGCLPVPVTDVSAAKPRNKATTGRQYCAHCSAQGKRNKTIFKCRSCDVPLCMIADRLCFTEWHDKKKSNTLKD
ncbi:piggyBac transposable element-derived protein 4-like [Echeneis naucrates]|uniref:PiggyBac transposable element-derived protein 4-like n=1 Tax=Echeneis naucrates TaxID=173247 RepID=A0A665X7P9_ECHNA|nr:piggyBac transposable element-derived protein 4-like [Echeneis naucrates]